MPTFSSIVPKLRFIYLARLPTGTLFPFPLSTRSLESIPEAPSQVQLRLQFLMTIKLL